MVQEMAKDRVAHLRRIFLEFRKESQKYDLRPLRG